ncbi:NYN domain-containing protein [Pseudosulfitobacter pseudonitzschiae]|uniref:LabA-like NYN domain-containing protein n=1 Tax=Pseudosulfitobacter pseudonitzschiae TaxID=1402135 RepID=UPI003B77C602
MLYADDRIAVLIDGVNLHAAARALDFEIDYKSLRDHFQKAGKLVRLAYYTTVIDSKEQAPIRPLIDWLDYNGFAVKSKIAREFTDETGGRKIKGTMAIELALDAMNLAGHVDHIILFTGDGEYRYLVEKLQERSIRVSICSTHKTKPSMASDELRRQADSFIELSDLKAFIGRTSQSRP